MKRIISILVIIGVFSIIIIQLAQNKQEAVNRVYQYNKETPIKVFGEIVQDNNSTHNKLFYGTFESVNEVKVSADNQGKIIKIFVEEGQRVTKGQALLKMDDEMIQLKLNVLETKLDGLKKDESRYLILSKENAIPSIKLEKTQNAIATLEAEKKTLIELINKSTVRAPFNGIVSMKFCEVGGFASPAIPLFEIINENDLKFVTNVPDEELFVFTDDKKYNVKSNVDNNIIEANLSQISSKGGIGNNFKVEFTLKNSIGLKPKMIGELEFEFKDTAINTKTISSKAIIGSETNPEVYLVSKGKAVRTAISILSRDGDKLTVSGINQGDTVVTGGFINLFDHANIIVIQ